LYLLDMGPIERNIAQQAMRAGEGMPDRIANAPDLEAGLDLFIQAFFDLDTERSHGFALTAIPYTSILNYARLHELDDETTQDMLFLIRRMDNAHLARLEKKTKK
jgi:hypothetical protein